MPAAEAVAASQPLGRSLSRAYLRLGVAAVAWSSIICWCFVVLRGEAWNDAARAAFWLLQAIGTYLLALVGWVLYNRIRNRVFGPVPRRAGEQRTFDKDYYGRAVAVAPGADFSQQHLVLAYIDNKKVYCRPTDEDVEERHEAAASGGLKALAAAVGAEGATEAGPASEDVKALAAAVSMHSDAGGHVPDESEVIESENRGDDV